MKKSNVYFENLDGLRFLAALVVVCHHITIWLPFPDDKWGQRLKMILTIDQTGGQAGVSFFFTLSGFLITYLLIAEFERTGRTDVIKFYTRRILRIWPLYYFTLLIGFIIYPLLAPPEYQEVANWKLHVLFLANFGHIYDGLPKAGILGVHWSVAVEEQFYLLWPLFFILFRNRTVFPWMVSVVICISIFFNYLGTNQYHTVSCMNDLGMGALAAHCAFYFEDRVRAIFSRLTKWLTLLIYCAGILLLYGNWQLCRFLPGLSFLLHFIFTMFFAFVILEQCYSNKSFLKIGSIGIFTKWGKISYGIYLLHMIIIYFIVGLSMKFHLHLIVQILLVFSLTIVLSQLSYGHFEIYFLKLKERFTIIQNEKPL